MAFTHRGYTVLEPQDWRMRWARTPVPTANPSRRGYLHHTAGNGYHHLAPDVAFYTQNEMAITRDGMSATDYSLLVHRSTSNVFTLGIARGGWEPAATRGQNPISKAVCAQGYYHPGHALSEVATPGLWTACAAGFDVLISRGWLEAEAVLLGHRDNPLYPNATACPGNSLYAGLPAIRNQIISWRTAPPPAPIPPTPVPQPTTTGVAEMIYLLRFGGTPDANWQGWVSIDWGFSRRVMTSWHHASVLIQAAMRDGRAIDAKTGAKVSNWGQVTHTNNAEELDEWLSPSRD